MRLAHYGHPNCTRSHWQSEFATPERMRAGLVSGAFDVPCASPAAAGQARRRRRPGS